MSQNYKKKLKRKMYIVNLLCNPLEKKLINPYCFISDRKTIDETANFNKIPYLCMAVVSHIPLCQGSD